MLNPDHPRLSLKRQFFLLKLAHSTAYYKKCGSKARDLELMRLIDEIYTLYPFFGSRQMVRFLRREKKVEVNRKRIQRLMRLMGLQAQCPKPNLSRPHTGHTVYPYLMRQQAITRPNQAWCTDITYIRIAGGFSYMVAIMDWHSRKVLSWRLSNTMDKSFCLEALREAFDKYGTPEIFNTDQGSQFTSDDWINELKDRGVRISMDGRGRAIDNVFVERLWRTIKYEEVYLREYTGLADARRHIATYLDFYNERRPHSKLDDKTPSETYASSDKKIAA